MLSFHNNITMRFDYIFKDAFDTFKVFQNLTVDQANELPENAPQSIWQILNHLAILQEEELTILNDMNQKSAVKESESWVARKTVDDQTQLDRILVQLNKQIMSVKAKVSELSISTNNLEQKLIAVQNFSVHLSFHLGEIVLIRRMNGSYPLAADMKDFLA